MQSNIITAPHHIIRHGGITIFNSHNRRYYTLDAVAALVWKLIQQPKSLNEICEAIMEVFEVETEFCERDLLALLQQMEDEGLIEAERDQKAS
jgi:hypothetical protein